MISDGAPGGRVPALSLPRNRALKLASALLLLLALLATATGCTAEAARDTAGPPSTAPATATTETTPKPAPAPAPEPQPAPAPDPAAELGLKSAKVIRVVDGDTAVFGLANGRTEKVRFIGIDTPESTTRHEPYGAEASAYTKRILTPGRRVYLQTDAELRDRYGRMLAYVWLAKPSKLTADGRPPLSETKSIMLNARLMRDGFAQVMTIPPNLMFQDYFLDLQGEARDADRGLWKLPAGGGTSSAAPAPVSKPSGGGGSYIGNRNTMKFHYPYCSSVGQMNPANKVALASRSAAISGGYIPCKRCNP